MSRTDQPFIRALGLWDIVAMNIVAVVGLRWIARSARLGAVYRNALHCITPELEDIIDRISQEIPDFHFGRFDIRFRSLEELRQGKGFRIVELNGAGAEMLHIWAGTGTLGNAWRTLWRQYRDLFAIGAAMRKLVPQLGFPAMVRQLRGGVAPQPPGPRS